jgi:tetratricopeptide (TPR) repeat protein
MSKILQLRGECLYMLGKYLDARAVFLSLAEMRPNDPEPHRALAAVYFDLGYLAPSKEELRTAIKLAPTDARSHRMLGRIELEYEHHQKAIEHYRVALKKLAAADRDEVIVEMATALMGLQQFQRAAEILESVSKSSVNALVLQAECERSFGHVSKAHEILNSAISISKTEPKARVLRAQWHLEDNDPEAAIALLVGVLEESPFDTESRYVLAQAYRRLGNNERAAAETEHWEELRDLEVEFDKLQHMMWRNPRDETSRLRLIEIAPKIGKQRIAEFWSRAGRT